MGIAVRHIQDGIGLIVSQIQNLKSSLLYLNATFGLPLNLLDLFTPGTDHQLNFIGRNLDFHVWVCIRVIIVRLF